MLVISKPDVMAVDKHIPGEEGYLHSSSQTVPDNRGSAKRSWSRPPEALVCSLQQKRKERTANRQPLVLRWDYRRHPLKGRRFRKSAVFVG